MADFRFEGCAIVSADGMLADANGNQPPSLIVEADQRFFEEKLDKADLIVHGRRSHESQRNSPRRKRVYATRAVAAIEPHPENPNAVRWNPTGTSIEEAAARLGIRSGLVAVIGATGVFDLFLKRYDVFWLTIARRVLLPGGVPVFGDIPQTQADDILRRHGLAPTETRTLDAARDVALIKWTRA